MVLVQVSCAVSRRQSLVAAHFFVLQSGSTAQGSLTPHLEANLVLHSVPPQSTPVSRPSVAPLA